MRCPSQCSLVLISGSFCCPYVRKHLDIAGSIFAATKQRVLPAIRIEFQSHAYRFALESGWFSGALNILWVEKLEGECCDCPSGEVCDKKNPNVAVIG